VHDGELHQATTPSARAAAQELLNSTLEVFSPGSAYPDFGSETSDFAVSYDTPLHISVLRFSEECVFATTTTLGNFMFADSLKQLTGANTDANATRIRDAVEVRAPS
jgi:hypothetical protein